MAGKEQIVEELGEVLLPNLVNRGLAANDRVKYLMTLLQTARQRADQPACEFTTLQNERTACGIDEAAFDTAVERSRREANGLYRIPDVARIHAQIVECLRVMLSPIEAVAAPAPAGENRSAEYRRRFELLEADASMLQGDLVAGTYIDRMTAAPTNGGDSVHLLVMNLHKELNQLQQQIAAESIDGACVYGLADGDRPRVAAFMRGVNRTRRLKFDHPGLDTTATRAQHKLVIQNDIGTTDAHVLVVHVVPPQVTITYSDIHIQRLVFFQNLFRPFSVHWEDTRSRRSTQLNESLYHLCLGRYAAPDEPQLERYLEFLGSRLVFLIDWNRARKRLRKLAPKRVCLEVLQWAADNDLGHRAFLEVGGEQLVFDALQLSSRAPLQLRGQLSDIIGPDRAAEFLKFTLKTACEGLLAGRSELLIRDEVRAELCRYVETAHQGLLELAAEHAALTLELAAAAQNCLLLPNHVGDPDYLPRMARRAKSWEHRADELVTRARTARGEQVESQAIAEVLRVADDAADELEEGIFLLTLLTQQPASSDDAPFLPLEALQVLQDLANLLVASAQEYLKAVENARHLYRGSPREDVADFLEAVDRTSSLEHQADDAHRHAKAEIPAFSGNCKQLHLFTEIADNLEAASDAMMRAALTLKDYVLGEVIMH